MLLIAGIAAVLGFALTGVLPEPARRSLEDMHEQPGTTPNAAPVQVGGVFEGARSDFPLIVQESPTVHAAAPAGRPGGVTQSAEMDQP